MSYGPKIVELPPKNMQQKATPPCFSTGTKLLPEYAKSDN